MRDIEQRIAAWRKTLAEVTGRRTELIDELESHLREDMQRFVFAGETEERALELAVARLGEPQVLAAEFAKMNPAGPVTWLPVRLANSLLLLLTGAVVALCAARSGQWDLLLATHVAAVTLGYVSTFVAGSLAACYVVVRLYRDLGPAQALVLAKALSRLTGFALGLTLVGVVLGGFWASDHLGHFWGWDPREIGGALVVVWDVMMLFFCWHRPASVRIAALLAFVGNIVVGAAWIGPSHLGIGLHSYGVYMHLSQLLIFFAIVQLVLTGVALAPAELLRRRMA